MYRRHRFSKDFSNRVEICSALSVDDVTPRTSGWGDSSHKATALTALNALFLGVDWCLPRTFVTTIDLMGFVNYIIELLRDPRAFIASMIATGPLAAYGFVFLIVFIETGVVFSPIFTRWFLLLSRIFFCSQRWVLILFFACYYVGCCNSYDQMNFMIGHFFGQNYCFLKGQGTYLWASWEDSEVLNKHWSSCNFLGRFPYPHVRALYCRYGRYCNNFWHL